MDPDGFRLVRKGSERTVSSIFWKSIFEGNAYIFNQEFPSGEVVVISTQCNRDATRYEDISEKTRCEIYLNRSNAQASINSTIKRSAWSVKAGLGHRVVLGMELERDSVSRCGALNKRHMSTKVDI
jgi:hypothetical protein